MKNNFVTDIFWAFEGNGYGDTADMIAEHIGRGNVDAPQEDMKDVAKILWTICCFYAGDPDEEFIDREHRNYPNLKKAIKAYLDGEQDDDADN